MDRSFKNALDRWLEPPDEEGDEMDLADIERQKRIDREQCVRDALRYRKLRPVSDLPSTRNVQTAIGNP